MREKHDIELSADEQVSTIHLRSDSDRWIFLCHGFADTKERSMLPLAEKLNEKGFNTVVFDFRGNGESSREFSESNLSTRTEDLNSVIDHFDPENIIVYGTSFGAKTGFHTVAERNDVDLLITKAPVTYNKIMDKFRKVIEKEGEAEFYGKTFDKRFYEDLDKYSFQEVVENIDIPVAIFHGAEDTTVHPENSFKAAQELEPDVMLQKFSGEKHSFSDNATKKMVEKVVDWIESEL